MVTLRTGTQNTWFFKNVATGRYLGVQGDVPLDDNFPESIAAGFARFDNVHIVGLEAQDPGWFTPPLVQVSPDAYKYVFSISARRNLTLILICAIESIT